MSGRRSRGTKPAPAGGQEPKRMRPSSGVVEKGSSSSAPATVRDLTVDEHVLECNICFLPLKPPIYQCVVGHVLCSPCSKSKDASKCYLCGVAMPGGYQRCHAMEDVMNSIRGPCLYASYGCDTTPVYHAREEHILECPHAPCHCPGEECSFVGSKASFLDHCRTVHRWPCITTEKADRAGYYALSLRGDGFNFLVADVYTGNSQNNAIANVKCLLLLAVAREPSARIVSVYCIDPHAAAAGAACGGNGLRLKEMQCDLRYNLYYQDNHLHLQYSTFNVICTDLSNGLPEGDDCFQFIVSNPPI